MRQSALTLEAEMTPAESAALERLLRSANLRGPHLEIGTAAGGTLKRMMSLYLEAERPKFVVVDKMKYFPDQLGVVVRNLQSAGIDATSVDFRVGGSWEEFLSAERSGDKFDFILIDASHKLNHVTRDLSWTRMLNPGGYVCLHDYAEKFQGVKQAADKFLRRYPNYSRVSVEGSLLIVRKNLPSTESEISTIDRAAAEFNNLVSTIGRSIHKRLGNRRS